MRSWLMTTWTMSWSPTSWTRCAELHRGLGVQNPIVVLAWQQQMTPTSWIIRLQSTRWPPTPWIIRSQSNRWLSSLAPLLSTCKSSSDNRSDPYLDLWPWSRTIEFLYYNTGLNLVKAFRIGPNNRTGPSHGAEKGAFPPTMQQVIHSGYCRDMILGPTFCGGRAWAGRRTTVGSTWTECGASGARAQARWPRQRGPHSSNQLFFHPKPPTCSISWASYIIFLA